MPPYAIVGREPVVFTGVNSVGLHRRGYSREQIETIQEVYRRLYNNGMNNSDAIEYIVESMPVSVERDVIVGFVRGSQRGILRSV